jgi:glycosyltransferase involved in cell wall biosynthesis
VSTARPRLLFVSPSFLFPNNTGGRIRTTNVLRGLKGGRFDITLIGPASAEQQQQWADAIDTVCDRFSAWTPAPALPRWARAVDLCKSIPVNVAADRTEAAIAAVHERLARERYDVVVFDFVHAAVLRPDRVDGATVCFTHNVEAEIFGRHATQAANALMRGIWSTQHRKMLRFERDELARFTTVVAVSERDAKYFCEQYGLRSVETIPTGVDLDYFAWQEPPPLDDGHPPQVVFTGSMDWAANVDGMGHFLAEVWPRVLAQRPYARLTIVGRDPPASLLQQAKAFAGVTCTGFVPDVRPYVHAAHVAVIPLRVGGGTRIKAFEAMAMGCPVVSTAIGIEGLDVSPDEHFLLRDVASEQAEGVLALLRDAGGRHALSRRARACVEQRFGHRVAARVFEGICERALLRRRERSEAAVPETA